VEYRRQSKQALARMARARSQNLMMLRATSPFFVLGEAGHGQENEDGVAALVQVQGTAAATSRAVLASLAGRQPPPTE
jgi:hypothetical protein